MHLSEDVLVRSGQLGLGACDGIHHVPQPIPVPMIPIPAVNTNQLMEAAKKAQKALEAA